MDNVALIGDAAHSIHPMAGQGLNLGLLDSNILASVICSSLSKGENFSQYNNTLQKYEGKSKMNNYGMQTGLELIGEIYQSKFGPMKYLRNFGTNIVNALPVKNAFKTVADGTMSNMNYEWKN